MSDRDPEQRLQIATHVVNNWAHDAWLGSPESWTASTPSPTSPGC